MNRFYLNITSTVYIFYIFLKRVIYGNLSLSPLIFVIPVNTVDPFHVFIPL